MSKYPGLPPAPPRPLSNGELANQNMVRALWIGSQLFALWSGLGFLLEGLGHHGMMNMGFGVGIVGIILTGIAAMTELTLFEEQR